MYLLTEKGIKWLITKGSKNNSSSRSYFVPKNCSKLSGDSEFTMLY